MNDPIRRIQRGLIERNWSREGLAAAAGVGLSTIDRIMSGARSPTYEQLIKLGSALGTDLTASEANVQVAQIAASSLGAYSRDAIIWLEGDYIAIRHSFQHEGAILAQWIVIYWDEAEPCMRFSRRDTFDGPVFERGEIGLSTRTGQFYLIHNDHGRFDLTVLSNPGEGRRLSGVCTTTFLDQGISRPASSATVFMQTGTEGERPDSGLIRRDNTWYDEYLAMLKACEANKMAIMPRSARF